MSLTYNTLIINVMAELDRTDQDTRNQVPNFISRAEQRIAGEVKDLGLEQYIIGTFTPTQATLPKPSRWRRNITFNVGSGTDFNTRNQVELRSYEFVNMYWMDRTQTGLPKYYCDYGYYNILVAPTPDLTYPFEWSYLELPEPLSISNQTNWLTNYAPDVIFYGTLLEAIPYLKDDERTKFQELYDRGIGRLNALDEMRVADRGSQRKAD